MHEELEGKFSLERKLKIFNGDQTAFIVFRNNLSYDLLCVDYNQVKLNSKKSFYNNFYDQEKLEESPLYLTRIIQFGEILKRIKKLPFSDKNDLSYIDVGAGQGYFVEYMRKNLTGKVVGIEPAIQDESEFLKKGTLEDIKQQYDFVSLLDVFEHFDKPCKAISKIHSIVKDDGYICLKVPNKDSLLYRIAKLGSFIRGLSHKILWRLYQVGYPPPHYCYYNKSSLINIIDKHFDVVDYFYISEVPLKGLYSRLWGLNPIIKFFVLPLAILYRFIAVGPLSDGLVIVGKKIRTS